jgi:hypothetical protein
MDIMELGAIGELVGGVAVIASLIYVGLQVRQSNRLEKAESLRAATRDYVSIMLQGDASLLRQAISKFENLSLDDQFRTHMWLIAVFTVAQTEVKLSGLGLAEESDFPATFASLTRSPGFGHWWKFIGPTFGAEFQRYVENATVDQVEVTPFHEIAPWFSSDISNPVET